MASAELIEESDLISREKAFDISENISEKTADFLPAITEETITKILLSQPTLKEAFFIFSQKQGPSTSALIKLFEPKVEGVEITVPMHKANLNLTEPIKVEWQLFLRQYFNMDNLILNLLEDNTIVKQTKAYTQREQLDELVKENPLMRDLIRKLNLKLK